MSAMPERPIHVLIVEDSVADAKLLLHELKRGGLVVRATIVDREADYLAALQEKPDIVLCDWNLPSFDSLRALAILKEQPAAPPLILVSGYIGEEAAVHIIKQGAFDYLIKDRLGRLVPAIQQALASRALQLANEQALAALRESEEQFRATFEQAAVGLAHTAPDGRLLRVNNRLAEITGYSRQELLTLRFQDISYPEDLAAAQVQIDRLLAGEAAAVTLEKRYRRKDGSLVWVTLKSSLRRTAAGAPLHFISAVTDISSRKQAEEALRQSEGRLRLALEVTGAVAFVWDVRADAMVRYFSHEPALPANPGAPEPLSAVRARVHPEDRASFDAAIAACLTAGTDHRSFYRIVRPDGSVCWLSERGVLERAPDGTPLRLTGVAIDDTERFAAATALYDSEERYRLAILATNDAVWDIDLPTGMIFWSERYAAAFGRPQDTAESWQWWVDHIHRDDRERVVDSLHAAIAGTEHHWAQEYRFLRSDGVWAEIQDRGYIARDERGQARRVVGAMSDVSDRKHAEAELRLRDRAIRAVTQAITITDAQLPGNPVIYVSPAFERMTGYTASEVIGRDYRFLFGRDNDAAALDRLAEAIRRARPWTEELRNYRKDGTPFWNELSLSPILDEDGRLTHFVVVQTDITARRALEEQLRQSQKMDAIGRLAGGVAHDFNNLLTVINAEADLLLCDLPEPHPQREALTAIRDAGWRAAELTAQLLVFSRKAIVAPKILDLNQVVTTSARLLRRVIGEDVRLLTELAPAVPQVKIDPGQLEQVLMNLAVNARDAMPRGGLLTITTSTASLATKTAESPAGLYAQLTVSDTGQGIGEEIRGQIFEPFFTTKGVGKGTGLGLATVYGIVVQAGGTISVQSQPGSGTSFCILLPAVRDVVAPPPVDPGRLVPRGNETILLAEDEAGVRRLVGMALRLQGYTVIEADCGATASRAAAAYSGAIHLLVTDVVMPDIGGRELADAIRVTRPDIAILYVSGYMDDAVVRYGIEGSRDAFLQKPFTPLALAQKVREVLETAPKTRSAG
jgi:PAS domain S-box-containing protein